MPNDKTLMCAPADSPTTVAGSSFDRSCSECGQKVMISPSGQRVLSENPDMLVVCMACVMPKIQEHDAISLTSDPVSVAHELAQTKPNMYRNRN